MTAKFTQRTKTSELPAITVRKHVAGVPAVVPSSCRLLRSELLLLTDVWASVGSAHLHSCADVRKFFNIFSFLGLLSCFVIFYRICSLHIVNKKTFSTNVCYFILETEWVLCCASAGSREVKGHRSTSCPILAVNLSNG